MKRQKISENAISRRQFLARTSVAALVFPNIVPSIVLGQGDTPAPSNRITIGIVGWGMQGPPNTRALWALKDCQVVAACDLDKRNLDNAVKDINEHYENQDCKAYHDYRELMARKDIDAVMLAVPDHWHALMCIEAARNKKHIYGEKPLAKTLYEQQAIVKAVKKAGVIWQTGSWQRSVANFHKAAEIVRNGYIGTVTHVEVGLPDGHNDFARNRKESAITAPPAELDYETWIGPSQMMPYIPCRVHKNWRWNYNTGGGQLIDWVGHHLDIAHWALDFDNSGPSEVHGVGDMPPTAAIWNTAKKFRVEMKYPKNISITMAGGHPDIKKGTKWIGTDGWVWVDREKFDASNKEFTEFKRLPDDYRKVKLYLSENHQRNWIDCIKSGKPTITPVETAHRSATPGHLGLISMIVGRKIKWDVKKERILGDKTATMLMTREYRAPWKMV
jgi:predicted dehydrogenase